MHLLKGSELFPGSLDDQPRHRTDSADWLIKLKVRHDTDLLEAVHSSCLVGTY